MVLIGTGRDESRLAAMVRKFDMTGRVTFAGGLTDDGVAEALAYARVVVTASEQEAFGLIVLEGREAGARVVASALPAHREVAQLDTAGGIHLWNPDTGVNGLADTIRSALTGTDPGLRTSAPRWADVAVATEQIYQRAIASPSSSAPTPDSSIRIPA